MHLTPGSALQPSSAEARDDPSSQLTVPQVSWSRRPSAAEVRDDPPSQLTVPQVSWPRRPSAVEIVDDGLSGRLVVPIYDEPETGTDGLPVVLRGDDDKPASTIQGVSVFQSSDGCSDDGTEADGSDEDVMDGPGVCRLSSVLSRLAAGTDLATLWRVPFMMHKYGVSFLCVYLLLTLLVGLPLFYMEFAIGQFSSRSAIQVWKFAPIFAGFGYAMVLLSALIAVYGSVVVAWSLLYLFSSMNKEVPWQRCKMEWNITNCTEVYRDKIVYYVDGNATDIVNVSENASLAEPDHVGIIAGPQEVYNDTRSHISTEAFFWYEVSDTACPDGDIRYKNWRLILCLFVIWCFISFTFTRKINYKSKVINAVSGLLMCFFVVLIIIAVLAIDDGSGAFIGLSYLFRIPWTNVGSSEIWLDAFGQLVLSYGVCTGSVICYGSRHRFRHNMRRDVLLLFGLKMVAALVVTLATFITLGFISKRIGLGVDEVVKHGPELLLVVSSQAMLLLPGPPVWSALFFLLLAVVGHRYLCFWVEPVLRAPLEVRFDQWRRKRLQVVFIACLLMLASGLALVGSHGLYLVCALDRHLLTWGPLLVGAVESIALCWVYGVDKWAANVEVMLGFHPSRWWTTAWKFSVPFVHMALLLFGLIRYSVPQYGNERLPVWVNVAAGLVGMAPLLVALLLFTRDALRPLKGGQTSLWRPDVSWGPVKEQHRWETYGVTFVAPEPILMVHVDSILKPELYGGIPHGYYLQPNAKGAEASDVLRQQEELRRALRRKLMMQKQLNSLSKKVVIKECPASSDSGSESTISSSSSSVEAPGPGTRRKSILVQAALLKRSLETSLSRLGSNGSVDPGQMGSSGRPSMVPPAGPGPRGREAPSGSGQADPALSLDAGRLLTVSEEAGYENAGFEPRRRRGPQKPFVEEQTEIRGVPPT
ncbi:sodium-dependent proline transporter-like [Pollicipes pollicipes]|uniref:sodium-dependent proline transporter-like n=1 Tax=Pollicipes pollicipes TaxID=41117 RepID=UPI001884EEE3|nr:sodium-dependent proline transporter-like [Pollicipes pollicipes]